MRISVFMVPLGRYENRCFFDSRMLKNPLFSYTFELLVSTHFEKVESKRSQGIQHIQRS